MKKLILAVAAVAAIGFTSCQNNKAPQQEAEQAVEEVVATTADEAGEQAEALIASMKEKLDAQDAAGVSELAGQAQTYINKLIEAGDSTVAAAYTSAITKFINDNKEALNTVAAGQESVSSLISNVEALPETLTKSATELATDAAKEAVSNATDAVKDAAEAQVDAAKEAASNAVNDAKEKAGAAVDKAANDAANSAKKALGL